MLPSDEGRAERPFVHEPAGYAALARSMGLDAEAFEEELAARAAVLESLAERGVCDPPAVAAAVREFDR